MGQTGLALTEKKSLIKYHMHRENTRCNRCEIPSNTNVDLDLFLLAKTTSNDACLGRFIVAVSLKGEFSNFFYWLI